jgi:hypothetical protein
VELRNFTGVTKTICHDWLGATDDWDRSQENIVGKHWKMAGTNTIIPRRGSFYVVAV